MELPLRDSNDDVEALGEPDGVGTASRSQPALVSQSSSQERYSVVICRASWHEVHCQYYLEPDFRALNAPLRILSTKPEMVAISQHEDLAKIITHRMCAYNDLLYVCAHNPMTDLHITELKELVTKADKSIALVLVLPAAEHLDRALDQPASNRLHAHNESRFVSTYADFSAWLSLLNMGVFAKMLLILPYHDRSVLETLVLWNIIKYTVSCKIE